MAGALFAGVCQMWTADPDVFWHLKVGEWIVRNRSVPVSDVYSWTAYGQPWTAHEWLWEALMYTLYCKSGFWGLWLLVLVSAVTCGLVLRGALVGRVESPAVASLAGSFAPLLLVVWLKPWPQAGVYILFSVYLLLSFREAWGKKEIVRVFFLAIIWSNVHSSAVMLPLLLLAEAVWWRFIGESVKARKLVWAFLGASAGTLLNPHGLALWGYAVREGLLSGEYRKHIAEWMPFFFGDYVLAGAFLACVFVLFIGVAQGKANTLAFWRAAGFWVMALRSRIYMPYAVLSTMAFAGVLEVRVREQLLRIVVALLVAWSVFVVVARGVPSSLEQVAEKGRFPVAAAEFVKARGYQRIFNDYAWGGYLIFKEIPVYIDGRADLYRYKRIFSTYMQLPDTEEVGRCIVETGAEAALVIRGSFVDRVLEESRYWKRIYWDEVAVVYEPVPAIRSD